MEILSAGGDKFRIGTKFLSQLNDNGTRWRSVTRVQVKRLLKKGSLMLDSHATKKEQSRPIYRRAWVGQFDSFNNQLRIGCKIFVGSSLSQIVKWASKK